MGETVDWITVLVAFATRPRRNVPRDPMLRLYLTGGNPERLRDLAVVEALFA